MESTAVWICMLYKLLNSTEYLFIYYSFGLNYRYLSALNHKIGSLNGSSPLEYPPEPTPGYGEQRIEDDLHGLAPTQVTLVTEEAFPYATTTEFHYAKEDMDSMQVPYGPLSTAVFL